MPKLVNTNDHPVRVKRGENEPLVRLVPGQVVECDGEYADRLSATAGVETASKDHVKRWEAKLERGRTRSAMPGDGSRLAAKSAISPARTQLRASVISAPLQRVVGDDAAPQGPPSGTITTKAEAATSGKPGDLQAFAQGEELAVAGEKVEGSGATDHDVLSGRATEPDIHNAQVDNRAVVNEAAKAFIEADSTGGGNGVPGSGEPIEGDYEKHTSDELAKELGRRGLEVPRTKPERKAALEADDAAQGEPESK